MSKVNFKTRGAKPPQPALDILLKSKTSNFVQRALQLDALDQQLRALMPSTLAKHCRLANITKKQLIFLVDSPVWSAKLRLSEAELIQTSHSIGLAITQVIVKVSAFPSLSPVSTYHSPSPATQKGLREALALLQTDKSSSA